jgi:hypothetical protein
MGVFRCAEPSLSGLANHMTLRAFTPSTLGWLLTNVVPSAIRMRSVAVLMERPNEAGHRVGPLEALTSRCESGPVGFERSRISFVWWISQIPFASNRTQYVFVVPRSQYKPPATTKGCRDTIPSQ